MMGGGDTYFSPEKRKDKKDMYRAFESKGYNVVKNRNEMFSASIDKPISGVFDNNGLTYSIDQQNNKELLQQIPTLADMTKKAIATMKNHAEAFIRPF
jgi:alkaline phosphatase